MAKGQNSIPKNRTWDFETGDRRGALVRLGKTEVRNF